MASNQPTTPSQTGFFDRMASNPQRVQLGLFILIVMAALIPVILMIVFKGWISAPQFAVAVDTLLPIELIAAALIFSFPARHSTLNGADRLRVLLLAITALIGSNAVLLGLGLPFTDRMKPVFSAGMEGWRSHKSYLLLCGGLLFGGLALMFVGVQLARSFERTRSDLRRVLYGFNAFLCCALLFTILGLINILAYSGVKPFNWFDKTNDWTTTKLYTLQPNSRNFLEKLDQPVQVFVIIPEDDPRGRGGIVRREVSTLLDNFRGVTDKVTWQFVSRDRDSSTLIDLMKKYEFREADGVLVVYGSGTTETSEFIKTDNLVAPGGNTGFQFKGESVLVKTIEFLTSGKAKAKIYFTQGQGELNIRGNPGMGADGDENMSELWDRLGRGNYELKELRFSADVTRVPEDASAVVIVRPSKPFTAQALTALREYMSGDEQKKKSGKLFILFDVTTQGNTWTKTGLEDLVQEFNVKVNEDRVMSADMPNPESLECVTNPESPTPMGLRYWRSRTQFATFNLRSARSVTAKGGPGARFTTNPLLFAVPPDSIWVETKLSANPTKIAAEMQRDPKFREETAAKTPVSLAVTVTEQRASTVGQDQQPKLVVFGDATWINDTELNGPNGDLHFHLFGGCLSWLRERPDITSEEGNQRDIFRLDVPTLDRSRLYFAPLGLMVLAVVGLGGAVWVARRR